MACGLVQDDQEPPSRRHWKVGLPAPRGGEIVCGLVQDDQDPPSMRHSNVEPVSVEVNEKLGVVLLDGSLGRAVIDVSGAVLSTRRSVTVLDDAELLSTSLATTRRS